jgi:hypothetical protein
VLATNWSLWLDAAFIAVLVIVTAVVAWVAYRALGTGAVFRGTIAEVDLTPTKRAPVYQVELHDEVGRGRVGCGSVRAVRVGRTGRRASGAQGQEL